MTVRDPDGVWSQRRRPASEPGLQEMVLDRATVVERMALLCLSTCVPKASLVFLCPGFTRTEGIQKSFEEGGSYFEGWTEERYYRETPSIHYTGRAAAALAADLQRLARGGQLLTSAQVARDFDFTDTSGEQRDPI